jgi:hypothetical protein
VYWKTSSAGLATHAGRALGIAVVSLRPPQSHLGSWHAQELWKRGPAPGPGNSAVRRVLAIANVWNGGRDGS